MERSLSFTDNEQFYQQLIELESRNEEYFIDTGIMEVKNLPLRLLHHIGLSKEEIAPKPPTVVEASDCMRDCREPLVSTFIAMIGTYTAAGSFGFTGVAGA